MFKYVSVLIFCVMFAVIIILYKILQEKGQENKDLENRLLNLADILMYQEYGKEFLNNKLAYVDQIQRERINCIKTD